MQWYCWRPLAHRSVRDFQCQRESWAASHSCTQVIIWLETGRRVPSSLYPTKAKLNAQFPLRADQRFASSLPESDNPRLPEARLTTRQTQCLHSAALHSAATVFCLEIGSSGTSSPRQTGCARHIQRQLKTHYRVTRRFRASTERAAHEQR